MNRLSLKAVAIGGIVDVLLSTICGVLFAFYAVVFAHLSHPDMNHVQALHTSRAIASDQYWIYVAFGYLCAVAGGYLAGRIAKQNELQNGVASSWLCILVVLINQARVHLHLTKEYDIHRGWVSALIVVGSIIFSLVGGYLAAASRRSRA